MLGGSREAGAQDPYLEGGGDPTALLSTSELTAANARREFINDDVANLGLTELKARLRDGAQGGDRASAFCHYLAASRRAKEIAARDDYSVGDFELNDLVGELYGMVLGEESVKGIEYRREEIGDLEGVKTLAYTLRHGGARTLAAAYINQTYGVAVSNS